MCNSTPLTTRYSLIHLFHLHSFDFKELRYLGHSQHLIIGLAVFNIRFNSITLIYRVNFSEERLSGGHLPARSFVFGSNLTTFLSHSAIGTDLETGKHLWTFNLESGLCAQNVLH